MKDEPNPTNNDTVAPMFAEHLKIVDDQNNIILSGRDSQLRHQDEPPIRD
jgi:hypothetical protein